MINPSLPSHRTGAAVAHGTPRSNPSAAATRILSLAAQLDRLSRRPVTKEDLRAEVARIAAELRTVARDLDARP